MKTLGKAAAGAAVVGVGSAWVAGALPGMPGPGEVVGEVSGTVSGFTDGIGKVFNGATDGLAGLLQMSPMLVVGGGAILLLLLLK